MNQPEPDKRRIRFGRGAIGVALGVYVIAMVFLANWPESARDEAQPVSPVDVAPLAPATVSEPTPIATNAGESTGAITGTVRWLDTQDPAAGVRVTAAADGHSLKTVTDDRGAFVFAEVSSRVDFMLTAGDESDGPFPASERLVRVDANTIAAEQDLTVWRGATITGRVVRTDPVYDFAAGSPAPADAYQSLLQGRPERMNESALSGVNVRMTRVEVPEAERTTVESVSDAEGAFSFGRVGPGSYFVQAETPQGAVIPTIPHTIIVGRTDRVLNRTQVIVAPDRAVEPLEFAFRFDAMTVTGGVVDAAGQPVAGATVDAATVSPQGDFAMTGATVASTTTDERGGYAISGLSPASLLSAAQYASTGRLADRLAYVLTARAEGFAPTQLAVPMVNQGLARAASSVIDQYQRSGDAGADSTRSRSGELPAARDRTIQVPDMTLARAATVSGQLVDTTGRPIPGAAITPRLVPWTNLEPMKARHPPPSLVQTGRGGEFHLTALPAGDYGFSVTGSQSEWFERALGPNLTVNAGDVIDNLLLVVPAADDRGSIRGVVTDARTGNPIESFGVSVSSVEPAGTDDTTSYGMREEDGLGPGEFLIRRVSAGRAEIHVNADGYPTRWFVVDVAPNRETWLDVQMPAPAAIEGRVTWNGEPADHAYLWVLRADKAELEDFAAQDSTQVDGTFRIENLEPADYIVTAGIRAQVDGTRNASAEVRVRAGETAHVEFNIAGNGRIVGEFLFPSTYDLGIVGVKPDANSEQVVNGRRVPDTTIARDQLEAGGEFALSGIPPGEYDVIGVAIDTRSDDERNVDLLPPVSTRLRVTVRDGEPTHVRLVIPE